MKIGEWKQHVLHILPPYVALKPFREIILYLWLNLTAARKEEFTLKELEEALRNYGESFTNPVVKREYQRCLQVLPDFLKDLVMAELLMVDQKGVYRKSKYFSEFWHLVRHVLSVEKLVKWGIYHLARRREVSFTSESLVKVVAYNNVRDIDGYLSDLVIFEDDEWKKVLEQQNDRWVIKKTYPYTPPSLLKPLLISDLSDKLLFAIGLISQKRTEFMTEDVLRLIRLEEQEEVERALKKLGFSKHGDKWLIGRKNPYALIEDLESPLRLPRGWVELYCLNLLDEGSYSWTELKDIIKADSSTISRSLNRLKKGRFIVLQGEGKWGRRYYMTNCDNCPFLTDKETCKSTVISEIQGMLEKIDVPKSTIDLKRLSNQSLKRFGTFLSRIKIDSTEKPDVKEFHQLCDLMLDYSLPQLLTDQKKAKEILERYGPVKNVKELIEKEYPFLPYLCSSAARKTIRLLTPEENYA